MRKISLIMFWVETLQGVWWIKFLFQKNKKYFELIENVELKSLQLKIKDLEFQDVGIAAFGPINLNIDDSYYGFITTTPKIG